MKCFLCKKSLRDNNKVKEVFTSGGKPSLIHVKCDVRLSHKINQNYTNTLDKFFSQF